MRTLLAISLACAAVSAGAAERDWVETTIDDLHFIRATLRENHPGPADSLNPSFRDWYVRGFGEALARARAAKTFEGYYFTIQGYMAGFHDGHLGALSETHIADRLADQRFERRWPHFTVEYRDGAFFVFDANQGPPRGAKLVSCDGRAIDDFASGNVGTFYGLWQLSGKRAELGPLVMIDEGNPFVTRPARCDFDVAGKIQTITLRWDPISGDELAKRIHVESPPAQPSVRRTSWNAEWLTIPSFSTSDATSSDALKKLIDEVTANAEAIRASSVIVFDVRGNHGGSSGVGDALLGAIWGRDYIDDIKPRAQAVDWRVSAGNLRFVRDTTLPRMRRQFGNDSREAAGYEALVKGLQSALDAGDTFYRETITHDTALHAKPLSTAIPVLLTDSSCGSACLDFADIVLTLPHAAHAGTETGADAVYIDNRVVTLPSGLGFFGFSMKVDRGRPRGNNESYKPRFVWKGDLTDTASIERWIASTIPR